MNAKSAPAPVQPLDPSAIRADFPVLAREVHGKPLVYLDSANTGQKPQAVIDAVDAYYSRFNANVARAVHALGEEATTAYEGARDILAKFLGANSRDELVFTSGTTHAINLVAYSFALPRLKPGDTILVTTMEHHANIVPWQLVCERTGATLKVAPINEAGELIVEQFVEQLTPDVKLAAFTHVSNVLGTVNPVRELARACRERGIPSLIDGSQAAPHLPLDVKSIGCDFYAITGHKMAGPTGTGVLWARPEHLQSMPPFFGGGDMIRKVRFSGTEFADPPHKFEAGTPNIAGFIGLGAAAEYLSGLGMERVAATEQALLEYATEAFKQVPGLRIFGEAAHKAAVISFLIDGVQSHDLATMLDLEGVAVRSGHHCAHPLMDFYGVPATARASMAFYNTREEIDRFIEALAKVRKLLA
ncbi:MULTISPECIES: cysteine desulfurase [Oleiagrimonas]|jgi:cysteine desulfurase / selenocysteine lyase|uniref:Cysteine desulfurase n=1 Tax=Oleiagrimonas citrea TaxID=1665687 RepID=A0A846ZHQ2_9GAMM|nr:MULTISPECIES: cysteine desulfurase [Oleiagrimonas]NKZ38005.1 cysteine desulfurase [Oleiagrimonas citrea]RAP57488.1 cysteine sulfinate desulfinase [Oleiagrimonas sp. MCCC 1A03011]